jgi:surfactin synthase thioesterase subunit
MLKSLAISFLSLISRKDRKVDPILEASTLSRLRSMRRKVETPVHPGGERSDPLTRMRSKLSPWRKNISNTAEIRVHDGHSSYSAPAAEQNQALPNHSIASKMSA